MADDYHLVPKWLNTDLIRSLFEHKNAKINVKILEVRPAVGQGENQMSDIYRVALRIERETQVFKKSLIIKSDKNVLSEMKQLDVFTSEMLFYQNVLPVLENEYRKLGELVRFSPKCYKLLTVPHKIIILEDLTVKGYKMGNRLAGLDLNQCKVVLEKLAKFHAVSGTYYEKYGAIENTRLPNYVRENATSLIHLSETLYLPEFFQTLHQHTKLAPYIQKTLNWRQDIYDRLRQITSPSSNQFICINHSDFWINNFLIKSNSRKDPVSVKFIDYQMACYGPPTIDLFTFLITATIPEVRQNNFIDLIYFYYQHLVKNLVTLDYPRLIPTIDEFMAIVRKQSFFGFYIAMSLLPILLNEPENAKSLSILFTDSNDGLRARKLIYNNPRYLRALETILKLYDRHDFFIS